MSQFVFPPRRPPLRCRCVAATRATPVSRIFCVGRNYAAHAREMGSDPDREPPFYFTKPANALIHNGATIPYPPGTKNYHYEFELVIALGKPAYKIAVDKALDNRVGLFERPRHDAPRPADRLARHRPSLGFRQGLREFRRHRRAGAGREHRPSEQGTDPALSNTTISNTDLCSQVGGVRFAGLLRDTATILDLEHPLKSWQSNIHDSQSKDFLL